MYSVAGARVYHGIWSNASLLEYTSRMAPEIELALRSPRTKEGERWKNQGGPWTRERKRERGWFARAAAG